MVSGMINYQVGEIKYPRVSEILNVVDWGINKVPKEILKKYGAYGTAMHKLLHGICVGKRVRVSARYSDKVNLLREWLKEYEVLRSEEVVLWDDPLGPPLRYGGTFDLYVKRKSDNKLVLIDLKTGSINKNNIKKFYLQLNAYKEALTKTSFVHIDEMKIIKPVVNEEGHQLEEYDVPDCFDVFRKLLELHAWIHS